MSTPSVSVDLTQVVRAIKPGLDLVFDGRTYHAEPPTKEAGLVLAAVNAAGVATYQALLTQCPTCGRSGAVEVPPETLAVIESAGNVELGELSLGKATYDQMLADGIPATHAEQLAIYAMYFWMLGKDTADQIFTAQAGGAAGEAVSGSSISPRGPRMASDHQTKRASTRATGASRHR